MKVLLLISVVVLAILIPINYMDGDFKFACVDSFFLGVNFINLLYSLYKNED